MRKFFAVLFWSLFFLSLGCSSIKINEVKGKNSEHFIQEDLVTDTTYKKIHLLNHFKGKTIIIKYWANWCTPCITSMPDFIKESKELTNKKKNLVFVTLSIDHFSNDWRESLMERKWDIEHFWIGDNKKKELFKQVYHTSEIDGVMLDSIQVLPTYLILNSKGRILLNSIPEEDSYHSFKKYFDKH